MGLSVMGLGIPLLFLMASIFVTGGGIFANQNPSNSFCVPTSNTVLNNPAICQSGSGQTTYSCNSNFNCDTGVTCSSITLPPPAFCITLGTRVTWWLPAHSSVTISNSVGGSPNGVSLSAIFANLGGVQQSGFINYLLVMVGIVVVMSIVLFSSGISTEAIHIVFLVGLPLAVWLFFSTIEGFLLGSKTSIFYDLDQFGGPYGTSAYIMLTLVYIFSCVKGVSRGGT